MATFSNTDSTTVSSADDCDAYETYNTCSLFYFISQGIIGLIIFIIGIMGNIFSLLIINKVEQKSVSTFLLKSLAFVDSLLLVIFSFQFSMTSILDHVRLNCEPKNSLLKRKFKNVNLHILSYFPYYLLLVKLWEGNVFSHVCLSVILSMGRGPTVHGPSPQCTGTPLGNIFKRVSRRPHCTGTSSLTCSNLFNIPAKLQNFMWSKIRKVTSCHILTSFWIKHNQHKQGVGSLAVCSFKFTASLRKV